VFGTEYPICLNDKNEIVGLEPVWDEECCWNGSEWNSENDQTDSVFKDRPPTYDECLQMKLFPICIFDVAIQHRGNIAHGLEVVHRSDISAIKQEYIDRIDAETGGITVYRLDADWILSRCKRPEELVFRTK
jgi:hypothetical protein